MEAVTSKFTPWGVHVGTVVLGLETDVIDAAGDQRATSTWRPTTAAAAGRRVVYNAWSSLGLGLLPL